MYATGVEHVTKGAQSAAMVFILMLFLSVIGYAIVQSGFNKVGSSGMGAAAPAAA